ncbi:MAG TPA: glycosyltransferase family 4 protein [Candidatus Babeliaceae bacterium]|nr:glycosyltransferase family 4 protein [Candidatus Babeliaceae bacterium]
MKAGAQTLIILTPGFPANEDETTCLPFLQTHIHALNKEYPEIKILVITFQYPYIKETYQWHGNEVICFGGREQRRLKRIQLWLKAYSQLKSLRRTRNIIGLLSLWCTECALIGSIFARRNNIPHFNWLCGQDAKKSNKYVRLIKPEADELISMSDFLRREFHKNHGVYPAHIIPIGIDPAEFPQVRFERNIDIIGAGSLIPLKQYDIFIEVINELQIGIPSVSAILCGEGTEQPRLEKQINDLGAQNNISLFGAIPHTGVLQLMQQARIFLHTSNYEGFGTVCLEALYAGAHVVSFTRPMDNTIPHWHHVSNKKEMIKKVKEILQDKTVTHCPVAPYLASDVVKDIVKLYQK